MHREDGIPYAVAGVKLVLAPLGDVPRGQTGSQPGRPSIFRYIGGGIVRSSVAPSPGRHERIASSSPSKTFTAHSGSMIIALPSATSWVFSSLHTSVGLAFVGAVVGEYLGSARGVGYLILQAEGTFDINTVFAGIVVLTVFALVLDWLVGLMEKRLMRWQPKSGETEKL